MGANRRHGHRQPENRHGETRNDDRLFSLPNLPQAPAHARVREAPCVGYTARLLPGMCRYEMRTVPAQNAGGASGLVIFPIILLTTVSVYGIMAAESKARRVSGRTNRGNS